MQQINDFLFGLAGIFISFSFSKESRAWEWKQYFYKNGKKKKIHLLELTQEFLEKMPPRVYGEK